MKNIALIGFMCTGKSTIGKTLAKKLNKKFIDIDSLITKKTGKAITEIFKQDGEIRFRELEIEIVKEVSEKNNVVIDCGGGLVLNKINIDRLKKNTKIILLTASPEVILERTLKDREKRPLLNTSNKLKKIEELLSFRESFYRVSADHTVDTSNLTVDQVVVKILDFLKTDGVQK